MKTNTYTAALDSVHVSQAVIEAAIASAKRRRAKTAANQIKIRYAAAAAGLVLASVSGYALYHSSGDFQPPVNHIPSPISSSDTEPTEVAENNATFATLTLKEPTVTASENAEMTTTKVTESNEESAEAPTAETPTVTKKPTEKPKPTDSPPETEPSALAGGPIIIDPIDREIDRSELGDDGKLYMMIAPTGLTHIDEPGAFTGDHVYYYETKFGRTYIKPLTIDPEDYLFPNDNPSDLGNSLCYFYNSRGEILSTSPIRWN